MYKSPPRWDVLTSSQGVTNQRSRKLRSPGRSLTTLISWRFAFFLLLRFRALFSRTRSQGLASNPLSSLFFALDIATHWVYRWHRGSYIFFARTRTVDVKRLMNIPAGSWIILPICLANYLFVESFCYLVIFLSFQFLNFSVKRLPTSLNFHWTSWRQGDSYEFEKTLWEYFYTATSNII